MYLRLLYAYILQCRLNLKWQALYQIESVLGGSTSFCVHINAVNLLQTIEQEMEETDTRSSVGIRLDIQTVLASQQAHTDLKAILLQTSTNYRKFWEEVSKNAPKGIVLQHLGFQLLENLDKISKMKEKIDSINPNNLRTLVLSGNFVNLVENNQDQTQRIENKIETIKASLANKFMANVNSLSLFDNINPCIVVASGDWRTIGKIKAYNPEVLKTLSFSREQIAGQSVNCLMPRVFSEWHDE